jgi:hypothetical protein
VSAWTVVLSEDFRTAITTINNEFEQRLQKPKDPRGAEKELRQWEDFQIFESTVLDLEEGLADPATLLKPHKGKTGTADTYVLKSPSGHWTGSFSADAAKKTYYGIQVYQKPS